MADGLATNEFLSVLTLCFIDSYDILSALKRIIGCLMSNSGLEVDASASTIFADETVTS